MSDTVKLNYSFSLYLRNLKCWEGGNKRHSECELAYCGSDTWVLMRVLQRCSQDFISVVNRSKLMLNLPNNSCRYTISVSFIFSDNLVKSILLLDFNPILQIDLPGAAVASVQWLWWLQLNGWGKTTEFSSKILWFLD